MSKNVEGKVHPEFSPMLFVLVNSLISIGIALILYWVLPSQILAVQWKTSFGKFAIVFSCMSMFNCFLEYIFHRYVLHKPAIRILAQFYKSHTTHHNLTRIGKRRVPSGREVPFIIEIENKYPMTEPEQRESAFFPWYSLIVFSVLVTPMLVLLQLKMPNLPWMSGGYLALLCSLFLYEFVHAIEHWAKERWDVLFENKVCGAFFRKVYSFHLRHHAVIDCNEAISGFFTLPIADLVFGTLILPKTLYVDGGEWESSEFKSPVPCKPIAWLDKWADKIVKEYREREGG